MGIRGLFSFVTENGLFEPHRLQDTILIIDGLNLENGIYTQYISTRDDIAFGGDYTHLSVFISKFFEDLLACGVTPVVIMDGSFKLNKLDQKKERFDQQLKTAYAIYQGNSTCGKWINSLFNDEVFVQVLKRLNIRNYKSIYEADDIIPQIAADLRAPILSDDSDFLLNSNPAGVISVKSVMDGSLAIEFDPETGKKYIPCEIYKSESLCKMFSGLNSELLPLVFAILGNLNVNYEEEKKIIGLLPRRCFKPASKFRHAQIQALLSWLSTKQSAQSALNYLKQRMHYCQGLFDRVNFAYVDLFTSNRSIF